jgi:hypothetical protein
MRSIIEGSKCCGGFHFGLLEQQCSRHSASFLRHFVVISLGVKRSRDPVGGAINTQQFEDLAGHLR